MPPQTHLTAEIAHLDLVRPTTANAARDVPAAPRPAASITVLRDAISEKDAAAPPGASGRLGLFARLWQSFQERRRLRQMRIHLANLSEAQLIDIGLGRADIEHIAAHRALENLKDKTAHLMLSRGVM
ncbi:DUF1127 domain-containing protein [Bradyrhizobium sp. SRS-191]|uniref:DUF1127 domain-containing protein n=1 Tax=Bradyrhizobium sp. SRS-191 TaxID=2962606 RepID=UPI00211EECFA|nr:DUF1127 domain-containing protein [Bradyrhizobium sp. SRS-191]